MKHFSNLIDRSLLSSLVRNEFSMAVLLCAFSLFFYGHMVKKFSAEKLSLSGRKLF